MTAVRSLLRRRHQGCPVRHAAAEALEHRRLMATYYVDSAFGNTGTGTQAAPFNTLSDLSGVTLAAGDNVLLKRGSVFRESMPLGTTGTSLARITYGSYGTGNLPVIKGSNVVTGWTATATPGVYSVPLATQAKMLTANGSYVTWKNTTAPASLTANQFSWISGTLYVHLGGIDPNSATMEAAQRNTVFDGNGQDYLTVENIRVENTNLSAFLLNDGSTNWVIQNCEIFFSQSSSTFAGAAFHLDGSTNTKVLNNRIDWALGDGVFAYRGAGYEITGNTITNVNQGGNGGSDGLQVSGTSASPSNNFVVKDNFVDMRQTNVYKGAIQTEFGSGGLIQGNQCFGGQFGLEFNGSNTVVERNVITAAGSNGGLRTANDNNADGIVVRNNIVYNTSGPGLFITNDTGATDKQRSNLKIHNNTFASTGGVSVSYFKISGEFRNNIVQQSNGDYLLNVGGAVIPGQSFVTSNNLYNETSTASSKITKQGEAEVNVTFTPGSGIRLNGVSTGVTPAINTGYDLLMRVDHATTGNTVNLWVNPNFAGGSGGLGTPQAVATTSSNWGIQSIGTSHSSDTNNETFYDNIRIGNTFADATGAGTPTVEETFAGYTSGTLAQGLNGGTGWGGAWQASNTFSKVTTGGSLTTKGDTTRQLASKISKTSGSTWVLVRMNAQSTSRTGTFQLHDDKGSQFFSTAQATAAGYETNSLQGDPSFVNAAAGDYHIASTSPARNAGTTLTGVTVDYENDTRDGQTDIGADEFVAPPLYVQESFDYTTGTIAGDAGGIGFSNAWSSNAGGGVANVASGSLGYTSGSNTLSTAGNKFQLYDELDNTSQSATRTFSQIFGSGATASGSVWLAFVANKTSTSRSGTISFGGGLVFQCNNGDAWQVKTDDTAYVTTGVAQSSQHLFVARVDFNSSGTDTVRVWVDPALGSIPSDASAAVTINDTTGFSLSSLTLSHGPFGNSAQRLDFDELRIGATFNTVTPIA